MNRTRTRVAALVAALVAMLGLAAAAGATTNAGTAARAATAAAVVNAAQVTNWNSGECLDVANYGTGNGDNVQQWTCHLPADQNQTWVFKPVPSTYWDGNQTYQIVESGTNLVYPGTDECLDAAGWGTGNGTNVDIWACSYSGGYPDGNQQWAIVGNRLINVHASQVRGIAVALDVVCTAGTDYGTTDGANVQLWQANTTSSCNGYNEYWSAPTNSYKQQCGAFYENFQVCTGYDYTQNQASVTVIDTNSPGNGLNSDVRLIDRPAKDVLLETTLVLYGDTWHNFYTFANHPLCEFGILTPAGALVLDISDSGGDDCVG